MPNIWLVLYASFLEELGAPFTMSVDDSQCAQRSSDALYIFVNLLISNERALFCVHIALSCVKFTMVDLSSESQALTGSTAYAHRLTKPADVFDREVQASN